MAANDVGRSGATPAVTIRVSPDPNDEGRGEAPHGTPGKLPKARSYATVFYTLHCSKFDEMEAQINEEARTPELQTPRSEGPSTLRFGEERKAICKEVLWEKEVKARVQKEVKSGRSWAAAVASFREFRCGCHSCQPSYVRSCQPRSGEEC